MITDQQNAVILARVSSKAQEDEGYSLDAQVKLIQAYCKEKNYTIVKEFKIAESASKQVERVIFQQMLEYIQNNKVIHLVVEKTDRLTRNLKDAVKIDDWLESNELRKLHFVKEHSIIHKFATSDTKFMWTIHLAVAKKYTDNLREEVRKGQKEKLAQGWLPGSPPVGYKTVGDTGKKTHVIDPEIAPLVQKMFELYLEPSYSLEGLTRKMKELGLTSKFGKPFSRSHIHKILRNPFYIGKNRWMGVDYDGIQDRLISDDVFIAVQQKLLRKKAPKYQKHNPLFKNMFQCKKCNGTITWETHKGYWYGHCSGYRGCVKSKWIREDKVENELLSTFEKLLCPSPAIIEWTRNALRSRHQSNMDTRIASKKQLTYQLETIVRKMDLLYEDRLIERITLSYYEEKNNELQAQVSEIKAKIDNLDDLMAKQFEAGMEIFELSQVVAKEYPKRSIEQKRIILNKLFSDLILDGESMLLKFTDLANAISNKAELHKYAKDNFVPTKNTTFDSGGGELESSLQSIWLGMRDSNPRSWDQNPVP
ncbi:MAG: recombinase family protein, partial [Chryseobacterium sp.]